MLDCVCPGAGLEQGGGLRLHKQRPAQDRDPAKLPENQGLLPDTRHYGDSADRQVHSKLQLKLLKDSGILSGSYIMLFVY